jgi:hypothetical protein
MRKAFCTTFVRRRIPQKNWLGAHTQPSTTTATTTPTPLEQSSKQTFSQ